jgi:hypothetical protein
MSKIYAAWVKRENRLYEWNECSNCGYKSISTIWHEDVVFPVCPGCGLPMENGGVQESKFKIVQQRPVYDISKLPPIGKCLKSEKASQDSRCLNCGWNETEHRRRLQCPWVLKGGLWHIDISRKEKR